MEAVNKYVNVESLKNKTLLELGGGLGDNGNEFHKLGCKVTSSDARVEHTKKGKKKHPHLDYKVIDGDKIKIDKKYDIILHWGLLYHLAEIENHFKNVCENCDIMFLETEVADSDDDTFFFIKKETGLGPDQAFNNKGIRPSEKYVEKVLSKNGFKYLMIKDPIVNSSIHKYDWDIENTKTHPKGWRRFWVCWNKNVDEKELFKNDVLA